MLGVNYQIDFVKQHLMKEGKMFREIRPVLDTDICNDPETKRAMR